VVFFITLVTVVVGIWFRSTWWFLALAVVTALLFSAFLVYDIQVCASSA
jgi:FtsH-binding integral membrane protein